MLSMQTHLLFASVLSQILPHEQTPNNSFFACGEATAVETLYQQGVTWRRAE
jgi:hypothetical protein